MILRSLSNILRDPDESGSGGGTATLTPAQSAIAAAIAKAPSEPALPADVKPTASPKIVKPMTNLSPSENVLKVTFSEDMDLDEGTVKTVDDTTPPAVKEPVVAPVVVPKPAAPVTPPPVKPTATPTPPVEDTLIRPKGSSAALPDKRDYTGFNADQVKALKQMPNEAFAYASKQLREFNQLQQQRQDSWLQHPQAYTLSPEYSEADTMARRAIFEAQHYEQQLLKMRKGEDWTVITNYDERGNPVYSAPQKSSDEADLKVANALSQISAQAQQFQQKRDQLANTFQQRLMTEAEAINAERAKRFAWVADPKVLEDKVDVGGAIGQATVKQIRDDFANLFAPHYHGTPIMEVAKDMFAALQILGAENRELRGQAATTVKLADDAAAAEINAESQANGSGKGGELVFDAADMPT